MTRGHSVKYRKIDSPPRGLNIASIYFLAWLIEHVFQFGATLQFHTK